MNLKERALRIGKPTPLIGVATEPTDFDPARCAVLILNSGVMHHVGACRLSVKVARAVAEHGLLTVRFDYSGIGDSEPRPGGDAFDVVSLRECAEVMDYVQRTRGVQHFILYGLCSGADAAYNTALSDPRVVGMVQLDAYCYRNLRYHVEHYRHALFRGKRWKSFLARQLRRVGAGGTAPAHLHVDEVPAEFLEIPSYVRVFPPRDAVAAGLTRLVQRGVDMYVIFTGGEPHYNHPTQYRASFADVPFGDHLTVDYLPQTNHIITQPAYQALLVERIARWVAKVAGVSPARPAPPRVLAHVGGDVVTQPTR